MIEGSTIKVAGESQEPNSSQFSLDIFRGIARVGFGQLLAGPVRVEELVVEVQPLSVPFDLFALKKSLPNRAGVLAALRARISDRQSASLLPEGIRITVLDGRLFVHGEAATQGRFVLELIPRAGVVGGIIELDIASFLTLGCKAGTDVHRVLGMPITGEMDDVYIDTEEGIIRLRALRWITGQALVKAGWKVPVPPAEMRVHTVLREGQVYLETIRPPQTSPIEMGADPPYECLVRLDGQRKARRRLIDARTRAAIQDVRGAVAATARQIATDQEATTELCLCASTFLPPVAILPWARRKASDFRMRAIMANAFYAQHDSVAAVESWLTAADQAAPGREPVFVLELIKMALEVLGEAPVERRGYLQRSVPLLQDLMERIPDDPELPSLILGMRQSAPFALRYAAVRSSLFSAGDSQDQFDEILQLLREAILEGSEEQILELSALVEARFGSNPEALLVCSEAMVGVGKLHRARDIWQKLHDMAVVRGLEDLKEACLVYLSRTGDREARSRLMAMERRVAGMPQATAAWLKCAMEHPGMVAERHLDSALALLDRQPNRSLFDALRMVIRRGGSSDYKARLASLEVRHGVVWEEDLSVVDPIGPQEITIRTLFRDLQFFLDGDDRDAWTRSSSFGLKSRAEAAVHGLVGRILLERYGRGEEARPHLQWAWDKGLRWAELATGLVDATLASGDWDVAQVILRVQLAAEPDAERRVEMGRKLMGKIPPDQPLHPELAQLLSDACRVVPWEQELRDFVALNQRIQQARGSKGEGGAPSLEQLLDMDEEPQPKEKKKSGRARRGSGKKKTSAAKGKKVEKKPVPGEEASEAPWANDLDEIRGLLSHGDLAPARARLDTLMQTHQEVPEALLLSAQIYDALGAPGKAADAILKRMQWVFDEKEARPLMMQCLDLLVGAGRLDEARQHYREWGQMDAELLAQLPDRLKRLLQSEEGP